MRLSGSSTFLFAACFLAGQETTIRTTVPIVVVPVTVTDSKGHFVYGLQSSDFQLLDNGKPLPVRADDPDSGVAPPRLVVLVQTSDLADSALLKIRKTGAMIQQAVLGAKGEAAVLTFSDEVTLVQDFTSSADQLSDTFSDLKRADSGEGRMLDAVVEALNLLANRPGSAAASILVIGENKDRGSKAKLTELVERMQRLPVTVNTLVYSVYLTAFTTKGGDYTPPDSGGLLNAITETARLGKKNASAVLTSATGGQSFRFETQSKLENNLIRMGQEIHSRYLVSFTPEAQQTPSFHSIAITIKGQPQLTVRTRPGYWSDLSGSWQSR
jgi:VWFA-related protein